jgi:hypothetical protein
MYLRVLLHFSTCFEQPSAHQQNQLYQYIIWYVSLCVGDCLVCRSGVPSVWYNNNNNNNIYLIAVGLSPGGSGF